MGYRIVAKIGYNWIELLGVWVEGRSRGYKVVGWPRDR